MSNKKTLAPLLLLLAACGDNLPTTDEPVDVPDELLAPQQLVPLEKKVCAPSTLRADLPWFRENRATLTSWMDELGCQSSGYKHNKKPIALFDFDNTILKNDIGDSITFHLIKNDKILQPPNQDWKRTSKYMTDAGAAALTAACGTDVPAGQPLPTSTNLGCADEMLSMYIDNKTRAGALAFGGHNFRRMEPTYAWTAQLAAGYTPTELSSMALVAASKMLAAPQGTTQVVGTKTLNGWLRFYDQSLDLIDGFKSRGYDVWIITASPNPVVAAVSSMVGVPSDRVIGIRQLLDGDGKLTYSFEGCGPVAAREDSMISYIEGKRCWINKVIYGDTTANAINRRSEQHAFGAGDSDTDIDFMRDAKYKLALNRQKKELMCFAYNNEGGSWLVNPMFIEPKTSPAALPCSTTACKAASGAGQPCRDEAGNIIPDQIDSALP
ncbi:MAG: haloacid dehalogenase-like hydrolase [Myxococcota bacterium]|nr:haloacid dehalogenase-like hydrolase [Myxococcota bacterium]